MATERKRGDKGVARTELVAVRFDPKTKYLMDLAARVQRRSMANYVEAAVADSLKQVRIPRHDGQDPETVEVAGSVLWHVSEVVRLALLKRLYPNLLTFDEQRLVELADQVLRHSKIAGPGQRVIDLQTIDMSDAQVAYLTRHWEFLKEAVAKDLSLEEVREKVDEQTVTVARIDARIKKLTDDIEKLKAMKAELPPEPGSFDELRAWHKKPPPAKKAK